MRRVLLSAMRSATEITETREVTLSSSIQLLFSAGTIPTHACGRMTRTMHWKGLKFSATAASHCVRGTAAIAPRTTSDP